MRRSVMVILLAWILVIGTLTGCGDDTSEPELAVTAEIEEAEENVISDEVWNQIQDYYAELVELNNQVVELYESDDVAENSEVEECLNEAADIIDEMGELDRSELSMEDAADLLDAISDTTEMLTNIIDMMEPSNRITDEVWNQIQDCYAELVDLNNQVVELYESDDVEKNSEVEDCLNEAADIIDEMGELDRSELSMDDAVDLLDAISDTTDSLANIVDAIVATGGK